jgi:hypothetical protein
MKKSMQIQAFTILVCFFLNFTQANESNKKLKAPYPIVTAPKNWTFIKEGFTSSHVQYALIDKNNCLQGICPSINISTENVQISLAQYIQEIKKLYSRERTNRFRDLGDYQLGNLRGHLIELDTKGKWGEARILQLICIDNDIAYIITATAKADAFSLYAESFEKIISSFILLSDPFDTVKDAKDKELLQKYLACAASKGTPSSPTFSSKETKKCKHLINELGTIWHNAAVDFLQSTTE